MIIINVTFATTGDSQAQFLALLHQTQAASSIEQGCLMYRFSQDLENPLHYHLIEMWQNSEALIAHLQTAHFLGFINEFAGLAQVVSSSSLEGEMSPYEVPR